MTQEIKADRSVIEMNSVSLKRAGKTVLSDISLTLSQPRIGVIGCNGSGKSTLARLLAGLIAPDQGSLLINGVNIARDRKQALRQVGLIFQNPDHQIIFPTVDQELAFGLEQQGHATSDARNIVTALLDRHQRSHWAGVATHMLSQGQRHFLCLLAVLAMGPRLILLDEAFAGLDIPTAMQLHAELMQLDQQILLISHDLKVLEDYDWIIWLDAGTLHAQGPAQEILPRYIAEMQQRGRDRCLL